ncbi:MAG: hypothetical protein AAFQ80_15485 [Cyanobacteria bacterium J06621_8]
MIAIQALTGIHPSRILYDQDDNPIWREHLPTSQDNRNLKFLDLIDRMVRCDYKKRYQSAAEVLRDLKSLTTNQAKPSTTISPAKSVPTEVVENNPQQTKEKRKNTSFPRITFDLGTFIAAIITAVVTILITFKTDIFRKKYVVYENSDYGIKLEHPDNWSTQPKEDFLESSFIFLSPQENDADDFQEKVTVSIERLRQPLSLNEYTEQSSQEIARKNEIIEPPKVTTFANKEGRKIIYQEKDGNIKRLEFWMINNKKAYIATYAAEEEKFNKYLKKADRIIESVNIE